MLDDDSEYLSANVVATIQIFFLKNEIVVPANNNIIRKKKRVLEKKPSDKHHHPPLSSSSAAVGAGGAGGTLALDGERFYSMMLTLIDSRSLRQSLVLTFLFVSLKSPSLPFASLLFSFLFLLPFLDRFFTIAAISSDSTISSINDSFLVIKFLYDRTRIRIIFCSCRYFPPATYHRKNFLLLLFCRLPSLELLAAVAASATAETAAAPEAESLFLSPLLFGCDIFEIVETDGTVQNLFQFFLLGLPQHY